MNNKRLCKGVAAFAIVAGFVLAPVSAWAAGLTVNNGQFEQNNRAYRGLGVNYYDAFLRTLRNGNDTSYEAGFAELGQRNIPFARINFGGFLPDDFALYQSDRAEYFRRLDAVVASAEANGVGLVPTLFWNRFAVPDLVGEPGSAWGDADSQTRAFAREYATEMVTRYRDSDAILMWEFGNEFNLAQDLPTQNPDQFIAPARGTPDQRTDADKISSTAVRAAIAEFAGIVNTLDPGRATTTGHSVSRPGAFSLRTTGDFGRDTRAEFAQITLDDHAAVDAISLHAYYHSMLGVSREDQTETPTRFDDPNVTYLDVLFEAAEFADASGKPLFLGEFGVADVFNFPIEDDGDPDNDNEQRMRIILDAIVAADVQLSALWVYDFVGDSAAIDDRGWNITPDGDRAFHLDLLQEYNAIVAIPEPAAVGAGLLLGGVALRRVR
ncbi:MAG: cellulase family glycosylhydrolase [Planctomycetota bacterium]